MANISIVTAFYDIGRGEWSQDKGYPHYLKRTTDTYIERFSQLTKLENDIVVFTSQDLAEKIKKSCNPSKENVKIVVFDVFKHFELMRENIAKIQNQQKFKDLIIPRQRLNPEYWNKDYVLVTNLKALFPFLAIEHELVEQEMIAWIDFGYCRSNKNIPNSKAWNYNFDEDKIHLFSYKKYDNKPFESIIATNDVYILGAKAVAHKKMWKKMSELMFKSHSILIENNLIDDDQGLWLLSTLLEPEIFELHSIPDHQLGHECFILFNEFNDTL